ncbi:MAG: ABC-ATPase domain-containing protein [Bacillota bacterium]
MEQLKNILSNIDGKGYKAYKKLSGKGFNYPHFELHFFHIQGDPFAAPSRLMVRVPQKIAGFPTESYHPKIRETALADYLSRVFYNHIDNIAKGSRGSGKSGTFHIERPGQEVLERTSARINESCIEVRFFAGMPAAGRRILGRQAQQMLLEELPELVNRSLIYSNLSVEELVNHI